MLIVEHNVKMTTDSEGDGAIQIGGAMSGFSMPTGWEIGDTFYYCIVDGTEKETGLGTIVTAYPNLTFTRKPLNYNGTLYLTEASAKEVSLIFSGGGALAAEKLAAMYSCTLMSFQPQSIASGNPEPLAGIFSGRLFDRGGYLGALGTPFYPSSFSPDAIRLTNDWLTDDPSMAGIEIGVSGFVEWGAVGSGVCTVELVMECGPSSDEYVIAVSRSVGCAGLTQHVQLASRYAVSYEAVPYTFFIRVTQTSGGSADVVTATLEVTVTGATHLQTWTGHTV